MTPEEPLEGQGVGYTQEYPQRKPDGTWAKGVSGCPGGQYKAYRATPEFRKDCRSVAEKCLETIGKMVENPGENDDIAKIAKALQVVASYGGMMTAEAEAKILLEAVKLRQEFKGTDAEWTKLVRKATGQDDEPEPPKEETPHVQPRIEAGDLGTDE